MDMPNIAVSESGNFTDHVEGTAPSPGKENEKVDNVKDSAEINGCSDDSSKPEGNKSSNEEVVSPVIASDNRKSNVSKKPGAERGVRLKKPKMPMNQTVRKVLPTDVVKKQGHGLSKSLSLPKKGNLANGLRKSIDKKHRSSASASSESINLKSLDNPSRRAFTGTTSVDSRKALTPSKPSSSISGSSNKRSQSAKLGSLNGSMRTLASDVPQNGTSHVLRKSSGSGFAFRSDERAQKRKEFYSKLEEKTQAKEAEKNNLQAKTMEEKDAEIKQLRKSLTFKATPMPSFYHEPPLPKGEIKKIPTTHPKSPKFGRHKPSMSFVENATDSVSRSSRQALPKQSSGKQNGISPNGIGGETATAVKTSARRSLSKRPSPKESSLKQEAKPFLQKPKMADDSRKVENVVKSETFENHESREDSPPVAESSLDLDSFQNGVGYDDTILNLPDPPDDVSAK